MNTITLYGRLGKDKEIKEVNGKRLMELTFATNSKKGGNDVTTWWSIAFWDDKYRNMEQYLTKGSALIITGEQQPPKTYEYNGEWRVSLEVIGKDIRFNPFGKGNSDDKKQESSQANTSQSKIETMPKQEDPSIFDGC